MAQKYNAYDVYNEIDATQRYIAELKAEPEVFFYKNGNPFLGFMHFLRRNPVPKKPIDVQRLIEDFGKIATEERRTNIIMIISIIIAFALAKVSPLITCLLLPIIIVLGLASGKRTKRQCYYTINDYKAYVIEQAISSQVEELVYEPNFGLPKSVFNDIDIIGGNCYDTEDLVTGKFNGVYFVRSDLKIQAKNSKTTVTLFKGNWLVVDYPKQFSGIVIIMDNSFHYGNKRKDLEKVELENPEFNNMFTVRASNMQLAYYLLTPQIIERLMFIKRNGKGDIIACFKDGMLHIGINNGQNSFEPNTKNINLYGDINKFKYEFSLVSGLIEILKIDNNVYVQSDRNPQPQYQDSIPYINGGF